MLPSIRKLAASLSCSVITTRRSYQNLEQQGYIKTIQGKGTFVNELNQTEQSEKKQDAVEKSLKQAIISGRNYGFTDEELKRLFLSIIEKGGDER
ncbi:GntR family transcriptional regulator [Bacillus sp. JCM 19041]|uniref:GntR family transcriptional regulator n=1 Tax=Bacillus sp. JCM 19041 TaxID=1460637 RepID=UPI00336A570A